MPRLILSSLLLTLVSAALAAEEPIIGETEVSPAIENARVFEPEDKLFALRLNAIDRSLERWSESAWGRIWASSLLDLPRASLVEGLGQLDLTAEQALALLTRLDDASVAMLLGGMIPSVVITLRGDGVDDLRKAFFSFLSAEDVEITELPEGGWNLDGPQLLAPDARSLVFAASMMGQGLTPERRDPIPSPIAAEDDIELAFDYGRLIGQMLDQMGAFMEQDPEARAAMAMLEMLRSVQIESSARLVDAGISETITYDIGEVLAALIGELPTAAADLDELRYLPAETLWALTWRQDRSATEASLQLLPEELWQQSSDMMDGLLQGLGLPRYKELLLALDGSILLACIDAGGMPTLTLSIGCDPEIGQQVLDQLGLRLGLNAQPDGSQVGRVAILPLAAGMQDGRLVITTLPGGLRAWQQRQPGFAAHPTIAARLQELPDGALIAGLSRSGPSWQLFSQLGLMALASQGMDVAALQGLPALLGQEGRSGMLAVSASEDMRRWTFRSEGLIGAGSGALLAGAGMAAFQWHRATRSMMMNDPF